MVYTQLRHGTLYPMRCGARVAQVSHALRGTSMKVDHQVETLGAEAPCQVEIAGKPRHPARPLGHDHVIDMRIVPEDGCGGGLNQIGDPRVRKPLSHRGDGGGRKDDVADQAKADEQDLQGSTVASSMSMTGISSLIG